MHLKTLQIISSLERHISNIPHNVLNQYKTPQGKPWYFITLLGPYKDGITLWEAIKWIKYDIGIKVKSMVTPTVLGKNKSLAISNNIYQSSIDRFQPETSPFSTRYLIWVNYNVVSQLSQPTFVSFSYLNSVRHNLVIELCRTLKIF